MENNNFKNSVTNKDVFEEYQKEEIIRVSSYLTHIVAILLSIMTFILGVLTSNEEFKEFLSHVLKRAILFFENPRSNIDFAFELVFIGIFSAILYEAMKKKFHRKTQRSFRYNKYLFEIFGHNKVDEVTQNMLRDIYRNLLDIKQYSKISELRMIENKVFSDAEIAMENKKNRYTVKVCAYLSLVIALLALYWTFYVIFADFIGQEGLLEVVFSILALYYMFALLYFAVNIVLFIIIDNEADHTIFQLLKLLGGTKEGLKISYNIPNFRKEVLLEIRSEFKVLSFFIIGMILYVWAKII